MRIALAACLAAAALPAGAQSMEPGEWQFSSTMTSPMLPQPQTSVMTECISPADAKDPTRFSGQGQAQGCTVTPGARTADSYAWALACPAQSMAGNGKVQFGPGSINSEIRMTVDMQGQRVEMLSRTTGRRLGPCKPK